MGWKLVDTDNGLEMDLAPGLERCLFIRCPRCERMIAVEFKALTEVEFGDAPENVEPNTAPPARPGTLPD